LIKGCPSEKLTNVTGKVKMSLKLNTFFGALPEWTIFVDAAMT